MKFIIFCLLTLSPLFLPNMHADTPSTFIMPAEPVIMVMQTNQGDIELRLFPEVAPKAVENFIRLAESGYYKNVSFHRIIKDFMIQGGDPQGTGRGGESIWKKSFEDEFSSSVQFNRPGILAMANAGPKTNGSQFFITVSPTQWLNGKHTIFGEVVKGYDVVEKIVNAPRKSGGSDQAEKPQLILDMHLKSQS